MNPHLAAAISDQRAQHLAITKDAKETDVPGGEVVKPYSKWKKADLVAEVERRNVDRDESDLIVIDGKSTVANLAAVLDQDDTRPGPAESGDPEHDQTPADPSAGQQAAESADQPDTPQPKEN